MKNFKRICLGLFTLFLCLGFAQQVAAEDTSLSSYADVTLTQEVTWTNQATQVVANYRLYASDGQPITIPAFSLSQKKAGSTSTQIRFGQGGISLVSDTVNHFTFKRDSVTALVGDLTSEEAPTYAIDVQVTADGLIGQVTIHDSRTPTEKVDTLHYRYAFEGQAPAEEEPAPLKKIIKRIVKRLPRTGQQMLAFALPLGILLIVLALVVLNRRKDKDSKD